MLRYLAYVLPFCLILACARSKSASLRPMSRTFSEDGGGIYQLRGQNVSWGPGVGEILFSFDPDFPRELRVGCVNAAATWNAAVERPLIQFTAADAWFSDDLDGRNVISFGKARRAFAENHAAETATAIARVDPPRIIEADIDFDPRRYTFGLTGLGREADVESTCLHEIGHALGLTHVMNRASIMSPRLTLGSPKRELAEVDRARVRHLYPPPPRSPR